MSLSNFNGNNELKIYIVKQLRFLTLGYRHGSTAVRHTSKKLEVVFKDIRINLFAIRPIVNCAENI